MGRTKDSLRYALIKRVLPKIENDRTARRYKKQIKIFSDWAKEAGYKSPDQITQAVVQEYELHLEASPKQYSPATIHTYLAPICQAAKVPMDQIRKPRRRSGSITRGREQDASGLQLDQNSQGRKQESSPRYARLVALQRATGIRRAELGRLTGADLVERGGSLYVHVRRGKGGKEQMQYILPQDRETVRSIFSGVEPEERVFSQAEMAAKINLHGMRAAHARDCYGFYSYIIAERPGAAEQLRSRLLARWERGHKRLLESDPAAWKRQRARFVADCDSRPYRLRGDNYNKAVAAGRPVEYSRLALMCVSVWHLSHWRLDVTTTNYLV